MLSKSNDSYILTQSISKSLNNFGDEIQIDLKLENKSVSYNDVYGKVVDIDNQPINDATIKLMSEHYEPIAHSKTDENGNYIFQNVSSNATYNIFAISDGYKLNQGISFIISNSENIERNFILEEDPSSKLGIIAGDLIDSISKGVIGDAKVSLFKVDTNNVETLVGATFTNEYGQFTFREIPIGDYNLLINKLGYQQNKYTLSIIDPGQIFPMIFSIVKSPNESLGTVSGIIRNSERDPVGNADVILYKVNLNGSLTPIAFTKSASDGVYLFDDVPPGTYKIKSSAIKIVEV